MQIPIYHVDAFADKIFSGNPATVCILPEWLDEKLLQTIAIENQLPATAFLLKKGDSFETRWFSPEYEIDLCGHGSLASGFVIFTVLKYPGSEVDLQYRNGLLKVKKSNDLFTLDFPAKPLEKFSQPELLIEGLGATPIEMYQYKNERCLAIFDSEKSVTDLKPNMTVLKNLEHRGVIVSARGKNYDFVSRTFYPKKAACEDAVTGSSHCLLIPYWANKLNKSQLTGFQASPRGGEIICENLKDRYLCKGSFQYEKIH